MAGEADEDMKLIEALEVLGKEGDSAGKARFFLCCGFTPLHLATFLSAHLRIRTAQPVELETGLYGDLPGNIERAIAGRPRASAVVIEWSDLDPRLGIRHSGGWGPSALADIVRTVSDALARISPSIARLAQVCPVAVSAPTLGLPPCFLGPGWLESELEAELRAAVAVFLGNLSRSPAVFVLNPQRIDRLSPPAERSDHRSELANGFPYRQAHADILGGLLAAAMEPRQPLKGIITDLDNTLWKGILGEDGVLGIAWDLAGDAQPHGIYQQFLAALAECGVLIGVASKNDPGLVEEALKRTDLRISAERLFPIQAGWGAKSVSVARILEAWNIAADSVVFIDDSPVELAEVKNAHPAIECMQFTEDPRNLMPLLEELRDRFGRPFVSAEDRLRMDSIRNAADVRAAAGEAGSAEEFLSSLGAEVQISVTKDPADARALELVNKTNQFNLNGRRFSPAEWQARLAAPEAFLATISYRDKFGPLGKIAVIGGSCGSDGAPPRVDVWVMSCRAFSRRIEHLCLRELFHCLRADEIAFDFVATPRNGPIRDFLFGFDGFSRDFRLPRQQFEAQCPPLYHSLGESAHA